MSVRHPGPLRRNSARLRQFFVAGLQHDLYDSRKASERVPRQDLIAAGRAIILAVLAGGVIWFFLWKLVISFLEKR